MCREHWKEDYDHPNHPSLHVNWVWSRLQPRLESPPGSFFLKSLRLQGRQWHLLITSDRLSVPWRTKNGWQSRKSNIQPTLRADLKPTNEVGGFPSVPVALEMDLKGEERAFSEATFFRKSGSELIHISEWIAESTESILLHLLLQADSALLKTNSRVIRSLPGQSLEAMGKP